MLCAKGGHVADLPHHCGWKGFEASGVEPVFPKKDQATDYAQCSAQKSCYFTQSCFIHAKH
jgi:hypothetical protein